MSWAPIATAPQDGSDILVRRLEYLDDGSVDAAWHAVACWWIGLWVFQYAATSSPIQLRFEPTEWMAIDDDFPGRVPGTKEEEDDAPEVGSAETGDEGSGVGALDAGDPQEGGS